MEKVTPTIVREKLPNGLVLVAEPMPHARSVSIGHLGARGLAPGAAGAERHRALHRAHGVQGHRAALGRADRARSRLGRRHARCLHLQRSRPASIRACWTSICRWPSTCSPTWCCARCLPTEDIAKEKQVILEEIRMEDDNPEAVAHEVLTQNFWRGHPLGWPIIGTRGTVQRFTRASVMKCFEPWYAPNNLVITAAGNLVPEKLRDLVEAAFGGRRAARGATASRRRRRTASWPCATSPRSSRRTSPSPCRRIRWRTRGATRLRC